MLCLHTQTHVYHTHASLITVRQVALGHILDHCMARSPALPTHRLGEEDASKGWRVGGGVAPVVTSPDETVGETGLTRSASHLPLRDCNECVNADMTYIAQYSFVYYGFVIL